MQGTITFDYNISNEKTTGKSISVAMGYVSIHVIY